MAQVPVDLAHRGTRRVEVLADAVERLARDRAARSARSSLLTREARADLTLAVVDARVEAVERADRRAAGDLAAEVVDAAVAGADEALRRPATKRTGQPRCMQRVEIAMYSLYSSRCLVVDGRVALAHVDGRLADVADARRDRDRPRDVGVVREVAERRRRRCQGCSFSSNIGPSAKPSAGSTIAAVATAPPVCAVPVMKRRRVTVSPSKAPGIWRSAVYFDLAACGLALGSCEARGATAAREPYRRHSRQRPAVRCALSAAPRRTRSAASRSARRRAGRAARPRPWRPSSSRRRPSRSRSLPASQAACASSASPLGLGLRAQRDDVGQLARSRPGRRAPRASRGSSA